MLELLARRVALQGISSAAKTNKGKPLDQPAAKEDCPAAPQSSPKSNPYKDGKRPIVEKPIASPPIAVITPQPLDGVNNKRSPVVTTKEDAENARPLKRQKVSLSRWGISIKISCIHPAHHHVSISAIASVSSKLLGGWC
jgi:hypothetical protein